MALGQLGDSEQTEVRDVNSKLNEFAKTEVELCCPKRPG